MSDFGAESNKRNKNGLNRVKMFYKIENGVDTNLVDCFLINTQIVLVSCMFKQLSRIMLIYSF